MDLLVHVSVHCNLRQTKNDKKQQNFKFTLIWSLISICSLEKYCKQSILKTNLSVKMNRKWFQSKNMKIMTGKNHATPMTMKQLCRTLPFFFFHIKLTKCNWGKSSNWIQCKYNECLSNENVVRYRSFTHSRTHFIIRINFVHTIYHKTPIFHSLFSHFKNKYKKNKNLNNEKITKTFVSCVKYFTEILNVFVCVSAYASAYEINPFETCAMRINEEWNKKSAEEKEKYRQHLSLISIYIYLLSKVETVKNFALFSLVLNRFGAQRNEKKNTQKKNIECHKKHSY